MLPDVDVVMMSKADTPQLAAMTQRAIYSAHEGAGEHHRLNVVVMEQGRARYDGAQTVDKSEDHFNYNRFANEGVKMGQAPWLVVANNDLVFDPGWLDALLRANHPVVSPLSPGYHRMMHVLHYERGWEVGRHLAGWCFMMARWVWNELGGLDESHDFWCSDNVVMDQLRAKGIKPMLVRGAVVHHTVSATLVREDRAVQDDLTWGELHQYNQDHNQRHLVNDPRYIAWKNRNGIA